MNTKIGYFGLLLILPLLATSATSRAATNINTDLYSGSLTIQQSAEVPTAFESSAKENGTDRGIASEGVSADSPSAAIESIADLDEPVAKASKKGAKRTASSAQ